MTERIQLQPVQAFANCAQLPGRETNLVRREMRNASGGIGLLPVGGGFLRTSLVIMAVEAIVDYFDD